MSGTELRKVLGDKTISREEKSKVFKDIFGWYDAKIANNMMAKLEALNEHVFSKNWWKSIFEGIDEKTKNSITEENILSQIKSKFKVFLSKLKQENSKLVVKEINTKKFVTIIRTEKEDKGNCLSRGSFCFEDDIINACYFIERDIIDYKETMSYLVNNYEEIINKIGIKTFKDDNKYFKKIILDTQQKLHNLKSKFIWE